MCMGAMLQARVKRLVFGCHAVEEQAIRADQFQVHVAWIRDALLLTEIHEAF